MISVRKTIYIYPDGTHRVEKVEFYVKDLQALEFKRRRDCLNLGCERIRYVYSNLERSREDS